MDKILLNQKVADWKKVCDYFANPDIRQQLDPKERAAIEFLMVYWQDNEFNATACTPKIDYLKGCDKLHPNNRDIIDMSKKLRGLAQTFYAGNATTYHEFREALGWTPKKKPTPTPTPTPTPLTDETIMRMRAEEWIKAYQFLKSAEIIPQLSNEEYTAIEMLNNMWRTPKFTMALHEQAEEFMQILVNSHKLHANNRLIVEYLKKITAVGHFAFSNEASFMAFQTFMKRYIAEHKPNNRFPTPQPTPTPTPTPKRRASTVVVESVQFANTLNGEIKGSWGETLYHNIYRITPKLIVSSDFHGTKEVVVVMRYSDGETDTYSDDINFKGAGQYMLSAWGNDNGKAFNTYTYIDYTINIDNKSVWQGRVNIKKDPKAPSRPVVSTIKFGATDENGNIVIDYGKSIPTGIKFLKPLMVVSNNFVGDVTLDIVLQHEGRAPECFTHDIYINGAGEYPLVGLGSDNGRCYLNDDTIRYSISIKGFQLFSTSVNIGRGASSGGTGDGRHTGNNRRGSGGNNRRSSGGNNRGGSGDNSWGGSGGNSWGGSGGYKTSGWRNFSEKISSIGEWLQEHTDTINTIITAIIGITYIITVIGTWISDGFFEALLTGVFGLIIAGIAVFASSLITTLAMMVLGIIFRNGWTFLIALALFLIVNVLPAVGNMFSNDNETYYNYEHTYNNTATTETYHCVAHKLNVRSLPSTSGDVIGVINDGEKVEVYSISNGFAHINYKGSDGYVSAQYIRK